MRTLITGGAGFIGSHLAERLLAAGRQVTVLDDLSTGMNENVAHLVGLPGYRFVQGSVLDAPLVNGLVARSDVAFHLAAAVGVRLIFERAVHTIETNVHGTEVLLHAASLHGCRVFLASTSEVYGKDIHNGRGKFREDDDLSVGPSLRWGYATSKALDEFLARAYHRERGLPVVIGRLFNTVGPRQVGAYGMVLPRFVEQALAGEPITVYGDGEQVRSFTWVGDVVSAVARLMEEPRAAGEVFNVGSDEAVTINDLARRVKTATASESEIVHMPYESAYGPGFEDITHRVPDISKLRMLTGYEPTLSLDAILERVIAYHRERLASAPVG